MNTALKIKLDTIMKKTRKKVKASMKLFKKFDSIISVRIK